MLLTQMMVFRASTKALPLASACLPPDRSMFLAAQVYIIIIIIIVIVIVIVITIIIISIIIIVIISL